MLIYLRSVLAGIVTVIAVCVTFAAVFLVLPFSLIVMSSGGAGSGGVGGVSSAIPILVLAVILVVSFGAGFRWQFRKLSRKLARS
jgi:hypothetical protein